jgi:hypothetical protein
MVPKAELPLMPSIWPMKLALMNSPSLAGRTQLAAKPIRIEESLLEKLVLLIDSRKMSHRHALMTN